MKACELQDILKGMHGAILAFITLIRDYLSVEELEQHATLLQGYQETILWVFYGSHGNELDRMEECVSVIRKALNVTDPSNGRESTSYAWTMGCYGNKCKIDFAESDV